MKRPMQRMSQIVSTFGPGAMIDLPTRSVMISGLDRWEMDSKESWKPLSEPRLVERLSKLVFEGRSLELRTPPADTGAPGRPPRGVPVTVFPEWFICKHVEPGGPAGARRRLMVRWMHLDPGGGRTRYHHPVTAKKEDVTPLRFVGGCEAGHLQDVDWRWVLHRGETCQKPMWLEERGSSGDPRDTSVICACGKSLSLGEAYTPGILGLCDGRRPWIGDAEKCTRYLRLLTRTATNTYFPLTATVISLPVGEDDLTRILFEHLPTLETVQSEADIDAARRFNSHFNAAVKGYAAADILAKLQQIRAGLTANGGVPIKIAEFDAFASGQPLIGQDSRTSLLHAETLPVATWRKPSHYDLGGIESVVAVHRLREVNCLYGFTRFEPAPLSGEGDFEEIRLALNSAPLAAEINWLPAVEQFGEGIFLKFDPQAVHAWLARDDVKKRTTTLRDAESGWRRARKLDKSTSTFPGIPYVMLHSLAHALMSEIALECGYPASAIKERIYAVPDRTDPAKGRFGLLLYTASAGSQGTLGGLIALAPHMARMVEQALDRLDICSNDPVCADHDPTAVTDERALSGSACHGCLFVAETSCERRNQALDRSLIVKTIGDGAAEFFRRSGQS
jgi:hypothetical protein